MQVWDSYKPMKVTTKWLRPLRKLSLKKNVADLQLRKFYLNHLPKLFQLKRLFSRFPRSNQSLFKSLPRNLNLLQSQNQSQNLLSRPKLSRHQQSLRLNQLPPNLKQRFLQRKNKLSQLLKNRTQVPRNTLLENQNPKKK